MYKNGNGSKEGSIFEDGLRGYLGDGLVAETWGRPLEGKWCEGGGRGVMNVRRVEVGEEVGWSETKDHSKWVVAERKDWGCFGDLNRMKSQWKRGGAFYCVEARGLKQAMMGIVAERDYC